MECDAKIGWGEVGRSEPHLPKEKTLGFLEKNLKQEVRFYHRIQYLITFN